MSVLWSSLDHTPIKQVCPIMEANRLALTYLSFPNIHHRNCSQIHPLQLYIPAYSIRHVWETRKLSCYWGLTHQITWSIWCHVGIHVDLHLSCIHIFRWSLKCSVKRNWTGSTFCTNESAWSVLVMGSQSCVWSGPYRLQALPFSSMAFVPMIKAIILILDRVEGRDLSKNLRLPKKLDL
jgi:hypothetical protein